MRIYYYFITDWNDSDIIQSKEFFDSNKHAAAAAKEQLANTMFAKGFRITYNIYSAKHVANLLNYYLN